MPITIEPYLVILAVLLVLSVIASKFSDRFGVPALLIFLGVGMLAGSDGPGGIYFDDPVLSQAVGIIALVVILFSGGMDTEWRTIRPVMREGLILATVGVALTAAVVGAAAHFIFGLTGLEALLLGAIISSTDAAAVFSVLRSKGVRLPQRLRALLELESGSNDPMAVFLTIGLIQLLQNPGLSPVRLLPTFLLQMAVGGFVGYLAGQVLLYLINRLRLGYDGLYPVLVLGMVFLAYGAAFFLQGSGFLAVYVTGLALGRSEFLHKRSLLRFYDGFAWLMQIVMFLTLGLLVFPSRLIAVAGPALLVSFVLVFLARPIGVMIGMLGAPFNLREKLFVSWVGLRGAVPIILGTYPVVAGVEGAGQYFNVVFFVVLTSMLAQGSTLPLMARKLRVEDQQVDTNRPYPIEASPGATWPAALREIALPAGSWAENRAIYELGLPREALIVLIARGDSFLVGGGSVELRPGDRLLVLATQETAAEVEQRLKQA